MAHEFFRYLIPGVTLYLPLYIVAVYIYLWDGNSTLIHKIKDYTAFLSLLILPTGWFIYQAWRTWWQVYRGGYESRGFLGHIRDAVPVYHQEDRSRTIVDFSAVLGKRVGMRWFAQKEFESVFDPFKNIKSSFGFQSKSKRARRTNCRLWYLHFAEPVSDLILFHNESYDYARSIASARYGMCVSIFAFVYGSALALALRPWYLLPRNAYASKFTMVTVFFVFCSLASLAELRARMAKKEHEARVQLITQINSANRSIRNHEIVVNSEVLAHLQRIDALNRPEQCRLAAFDMDGTLIREDMGDAVLAMLIQQGKVPYEKWNEYQKLLLNSRPRAYEFAVTAMEGSSVDDVNQATRRVLELKPEATIQLRGNISVPRPVVIPEMQALVMWLHCHNYHVYIVSATNRWAAAIIGADFFGVTEDRVIGVEVEVSRGRLTNKVKRPAPIGNGKVEAWQERLGDSHPLVVAGDSEGDHPLLNFVDKSGVVIWRGLADEKPAARPIVELS